MKACRVKTVEVLATCLAFIILLSFPCLGFSQTVTIDNDIPQGTFGHWSVEVSTGGAIEQESQALITTRGRATGELITDEVLMVYFLFVDVGPLGGGGFVLLGSPPIVDASDPDEASSSGSFIGANGNTINWSVRSNIPDEGQTMTNTYTFSTPDESELGELRLLQYMIGLPGILRIKGVPAGGNLELFAKAGDAYGASQSGAFSEFSDFNLQNAVFAGWAAGDFLMWIRSAHTGQAIAPEGIIENLSTYVDPYLGRVLGPDAFTSVLAWDVIDDESEAVIETTLEGTPDQESILKPFEITPPGGRSIYTDDLIGFIDPNLPTIVLTHGLQWKDETPEDLWTGFGPFNKAGTLLSSKLRGSVNVIQYLWEEAHKVDNWPDIFEYVDARVKVYDAGENLARILLDELGAGYNKEIHFIGHSLGTAVNAYGARLFLNQAHNVTQAQFTILDYPNHIRKIPPLHNENDYTPIAEQVESIWGFGPDFFSSLLPIARQGLNLKIDNFFASQEVHSYSGVGDIVNGPVYNHRLRPTGEQSGLVNPNNVHIYFLEEGWANDHSGVHQWYRWTIAPNYLALGGIQGRTNICNPHNNQLIFMPPSFNSSLDPCGQGWSWSINNPERIPFPLNNGEPIIISTRTVLDLDLEFFAGVGCRLDTTGDLPQVTCTESSSPFGIAEVSIPEDAEYLSFEYRFTDIGDGDYAAVLVDEVPIWVLSGLSTTQEDFVNSGPLPIGGLAGERKLTIALYGAGEPNAEFEIKNFSTNHVETVPTRTLEIDIKPGKVPNSIDPMSGQKISVAILTTEAFDATTVDPLSVEFGPGGAVEAHGRGHIKDADEDGDLDLILHFNTSDTDIECGSSWGSLTGETFDGELIQGSDSINTVRCK